MRSDSSRNGHVPAAGRNGHVEGSATPAFRLHEDGWGRLVLTDGTGRQHVGVEPVRAFPLSSPGRGLSICDAEGRELVWVDDLEALPAELRGVLQERLAGREFVPII